MWIPVQLLIDAAVIAFGLYLDIKLYHPLPDQPGTAFPMLTAMIFIFFAIVTIIVVLAAIIMTVINYINKNNRE